jgi:hypothetical protein
VGVDAVVPRWDAVVSTARRRREHRGRRSLAFAVLAMLLGAAPGCGRPPPVSVSPGAPGAVAAVGHVRIPTAIVSEVAEAQRTTSARALDALIDDALAAEAARARGLDRSPAAEWATASALAARVIAVIDADAAALGAPRPEEQSTRRVIHVVVLESATLGEDRGRPMAAAFARAVERARSEREFEALARQVPHAEARLVVETLGPFAIDGRLPNGTMLDPAFVAAAFALRSVGATSPVVRTRFGWHVLRALPEPDASPQPAPPATEDLLRVRSLQARQIVLEKQRASHGVLVTHGAGDILARTFGDAP